jgi:tRNA (cytidine/uridine-2'-O-)-methyltransferase
VPENVHAAVDAAVRVPMRAGERSLNVAVCAGIALWEGLRQTHGLVDGSD